MFATVENFSQWRDKARAFLIAGAAPEEVHWGHDQPGLFDGAAQESTVELREPSPSPRVPKAFLPLAEAAACYRHPARWALLYRLLWRLNHGEPELLQIATDSDVVKLNGMAAEVRRDVHKMHAFVRFRKMEETYVAWHEPAHLIVERACPFFARRFESMRWSILTPDRCAYWDGHELVYGPGVTRAQAPTADAMEELWKTYYRNIFNPARVKVSAMVSEMPKRYWKTMPETALIPSMLSEAEARVQTMLEHSQQREGEAYPHDAANEVVEAGGTLEELRALAMGCQACELYRDATQTVFGEGPVGARMMLIGEQPGDQEDRRGRPFVGPAGQLLRRALAEAGVSPEEVYLSNTVKHFRWEPSPHGGKRRLHQRATSRQILTCQGWVRGEIKILKPRVLVCLGATAAQALLGAQFRLGRDRGRWLESPLAERVMATVHPSFLLRISDGKEQEREKARFLDDLRLAVSGLSE